MTFLRVFKSALSNGIIFSEFPDNNFTNFLF